MSKKLAAFTILFVFLDLLLSAQSVQHISLEDFDVHYTTTNGKLEGKYKSYFNNKQLRAKGKFENNYRIGKWTLWDYSGNKKIERIYSSPFTYKQKFPKRNSLPKTAHSLENNQVGYIDYFQVEETMILWYKRFWRKLEPSNNAILFEKNYLFNKMVDLIGDSSIHVYSGEDDSFRKEIPYLNPSPEETDILYYKIKEDWFMDTIRFVMESRIIGICPVANIDGDITDLFWLYYPQLRKPFAQEKLKSKQLPSHINTLEGLFFYRFFSGEVYKENYEIIHYEGNKENARKVEIQLIESEHEMWTREKHPTSK